MDDDLPLAISHAAMNAACISGEAVPLAAAHFWLTRYRGTWWVVYERGWLRITDELTLANIDNCAARTGATSSKEEPCPPPR